MVARTYPVGRPSTERVINLPPIAVSLVPSTHQTMLRVLFSHPLPAPGTLHVSGFTHPSTRLLPPHPALSGSSPDVPHLLIVTTADLDSVVRRYARYRETRGVEVEVITVEEIDQIRPEGTRRERIRAFLRDQVAQGRIQYVFLVGPLSRIPAAYTRVRGVYPPLTFYETVPTDRYYAHLTGTLNEDGDTLIGEPEDGFNPAQSPPQLAVGRLVVQNPDEFRLYMEKVQRYLDGFREDAPGLVLAPKLSPSLPATLYTGFILSDLSLDTLFLAESGGQTVSRSAFLSALQHPPQWILSVNHAYNDILELNYSPWREMRYASFAALDTASPPMVWFVIACETGAFDEGSISQALLLEARGGAVAYYSMTRLDFPDISKFLARSFFQNMVQVPFPRIGDLDLAAREYLRPYTSGNSVPRYIYMGYALQGDPTLPLHRFPTKPARLVFRPRYDPLLGWLVDARLSPAVDPQARIVLEYGGKREILPLPLLEHALKGTGPGMLHLRAWTVGPLHQPDSLQQWLVRPSGWALNWELDPPSSLHPGDTLQVSLRVENGTARSLPVSLHLSLGAHFSRVYAWEMPPLQQTIIPDSPVVFVLPGEDTVRLHADLRDPLGHPLASVDTLLVLTPVMPVPVAHRRVGNQLWLFLDVPDSVRPTLVQVRVDTSALLPGPVWLHPSSGGILQLGPWTLPSGVQRVQIQLSQPGYTLTFHRMVLDAPPAPMDTLQSRALPGGSELYLRGTTCTGLLLEHPPDGKVQILHRTDLPAPLDSTLRANLHVDCLDRFGGAWTLADSWTPVRGPIPTSGTPILLSEPVNFADPVPDSSSTRIVLYNGAVVVYRHPDGSLVQYVPPVNPSAEVFMRPTAARMNPGGWTLVFAQRNPSGIRMIHPDGRSLWISGSFPLTSVYIAWDGDGDGQDEVYIPAGSRLLRLTPAGTVDTLLTSIQIQGTPALSLQPDTALLLSVRLGGLPHLLRYRLRDGFVDTVTSLVWGGGVYVGQLDANPDEDLVFVSGSGLEIRHGDGTLLDTLPLSVHKRWVSLVDRNGDGQSELYLPVREGSSYRILGLSPAGDTVFAPPITWDRGLAFGTPLTGCDSLLFYGNRGDELWGWGTEWVHMRMPGKTAGSVTVLRGEIRVLSWLRAGFFIFPTPTTCNSPSWPMADHDHRRTRNQWTSASILATFSGKHSPHLLLQAPTVYTREAFSAQYRHAFHRGQLFLIDRTGRRYIQPDRLPSGVYWLIQNQKPRNNIQKILILP